MENSKAYSATRKRISTASKQHEHHASPLSALNTAVGLPLPLPSRTKLSKGPMYHDSHASHQDGPANSDASEHEPFEDIALDIEPIEQDESSVPESEHLSAAAMSSDSLSSESEDAPTQPYSWAPSWLFGTKTQAQDGKESDRLMLLAVDESFCFDQLDASAGLYGLVNLGNTCFMNSALQCLTHSTSLNSYFLRNQHLKEINRSNPLGMRGMVAESYGRLISSLWPTRALVAQQAGSPRSIVPKELKNIIGRYAPQFAGYQQHDSQELLGFLLDGLHEDLNRIKSKPYIEMKDADGRSDLEVSKESWDIHMKRNDSIIVDLFQGQFKSTLVCPECGKVSVTFDPFMYLSLPLPFNKKAISVPFIAASLRTEPEHLTITFVNRSSMLDMKEEISSIKNIDKSHIAIALVVQNELQGTLSDYRTLSSVISPSCLVAYEIPPLEDTNSIHAWLTFEAAATATAGSDSDQVDILSVESEAKPRARFFSYPRLVTLSRRYASYSALYHDVRSALIDASLVTNEPVAAFRIESQESQQFLYTHEHGSEWNTGTATEIEFKTHSSPYYLSAVHLSLVWTKDILGLSCPLVERSLEDASGCGSISSQSSTLSIFDCLDLFTKREKLGFEDPWYCSRCKGHRQATKKLDLWRTPPLYLVVHLKRFSFSRIFRDKIDTLVDFPIEGLDLRENILGPDQEDAIYDLYAVSNHFGGLGGGHYTAYVKHPIDGRWYHCDDSSVTLIQEPERTIRSLHAYVLFYKKRNAEPLF